MSESEIPKHVAIVMDGNGRWAKERGHARVFGHIRGAKRVKPIVREANRLGVKALTLFAFSSENWIRPKTEIETLWKILEKYLLKEGDELDENNVRFRAIGQLERLPARLRRVIADLEKRLSGNSGLILTFAISYGAQDEIVHAMREFAQACVERRAHPEELKTEGVYRYLWTRAMGELADVDLFIRTSGESRISNFLLWQSAYAEFSFLDVCWPDFYPQDLRKVIAEFSQRDRRFGGLQSSLGRRSQLPRSVSSASVRD